MDSHSIRQVSSWVGPSKNSCYTALPIVCTTPFALSGLRTMAAAQVVATGLLLLVFAVSGGAVKCKVAVFTDIPSYDISEFSSISNLDCAVACRDNRECIAFVTSPSNQCWLKYALHTPGPQSERAVFYTGGEDCTALFTDQNGTAIM